MNRAPSIRYIRGAKTNIEFAIDRLIEEETQGAAHVDDRYLSPKTRKRLLSLRSVKTRLDNLIKS